MSDILAGAAVRLAIAAFGQQDAGTHPCFRVKNLDHDEVVSFVEAWRRLRDGSSLGHVRLVVAEDLGGRIPAEFVAEPGNTITFYRNNNPRGLIYLETRVQSDEQGLQNMFTLRDSNFLDGSFDAYAAGHGTVAGLLLDEAWRAAAPAQELPSLLQSLVLKVIELLHPGVVPVPVRRFVSFTEHVCRDWIGRAQPIDGRGAVELVGRALSSLDLFPDPSWRDGQHDARTRRRLELNARHAELVSAGTEIDQDEVRRLTRATRFVDADGAALPAGDAARWADLCIRYAGAPSAQLRQQIPYTIFEQLFRRDTVGLSLGERVRTEIAHVAPERLPELDQSDVCAGLDARSGTDAARLLDAEAGQGRVPLVDLLSAKTKRSIERLAFPPARRFLNPAIELVRALQRVKSEHEGSSVARVRVELSPSAVAGSPAVGLLAFVFGPTLKAIADSCTGLPGTCEVELAPELVTVPAVPEAAPAGSDDETGEEVQGVEWLPVPLRMTFHDHSGRQLEVIDQLEWTPPGLCWNALAWLLVAAPLSPLGQGIGALQVEAAADDEWLQPVLQGGEALQSLRPGDPFLQAGVHPLIDELLAQRRELHRALAVHGMDSQVIGTFLDTWKELVFRARREFVPDGVRRIELEAFLHADTLAERGSDRRHMLPLHPVRLRWIAAYLDECRRLAVSCLSGEAAFADGEGEHYLGWLESLSPRESPPIALAADGELVYARAETGWFEEFRPLEGASADTGVDALAVASIASRIVDYLDAHPFKRDGLSLLIVLPASDALAARLVERISRGPYRDLRLFILVAAPKSRWEGIARSVEVLAHEEQDGPRRRLFPSRDLGFIEYDTGDDISSLLAGQRLDVAVVTHMLQEQVICQQNTEPPTDRPGVFSPLHDRPARLESSGDGGAISVVMRPRHPDPVLESWGTLVVRANRSRPVAPSQPDNTDFVELRINFQDSARLFNALHAACHWVITLERHISRQQIESEAAGAPDVLSLEEGVGMNGLNTLVVSSRSGRDLIESRLARKLAKLAGADMASGRDLLAALAARIYAETRRIAPRLALQALGIARVTEEILGLAVALNQAEMLAPAAFREGVSAWLSLDEHADWLGRTDQVRADLCRLTIERDPAGILVVDVLVLEGKLRQVYDPHGLVQVRATVDFFRSVLAPEIDDGVRKVDAPMWRERIMAAVEGVAPEAMTLHSAAPGPECLPDSRLLQEIGAAFRTGRFTLREVRGIYSACLWETETEEVAVSCSEDVTVVRSSRRQLLALAGKGTPSAAGSALATPGLTAAAARPGAGDHGDLAIPDARDVVATGTDSPGPGATAGRAGPRRSGLAEGEARRLYDAVLQCFGTHGLDVLPASPGDDPVVEGPASVLFKVRPAAGVDPRKLPERAQALKLALRLEHEQNVGFGIDRGYVTVDVPKREEQRYFVDAGETWRRWQRPDGALSVPLGEDRFGDIVELSFSSPNSPHLLVAGTTGSGKSEALNAILFGLVRHYTPAELRLLLVDPKGTELVPFDGCRHMQGPLGWDESDALELLRMAVEEMQRRYVLFREHRQRSLPDFNAAVPAQERLPWWLVVLDEYADLTHDPQARKNIEAELKRLAQKARAAGIHVIIATQKPSAEVISTNLRSNLGAQLALRVKSATESRVVLDEAGAENLNGKGDALLKADGRLRRLQCARVSAGDQRLDAD